MRAQGILSFALVSLCFLAVSGDDIYKALFPLDFPDMMCRHKHLAPPVNIMSGFYDTRPLLFSHSPRIVVIGAVMNGLDDINPWRDENSLTCLVGTLPPGSVNEERDLVVDPKGLEVVFSSPASAKVLGVHPRQQEATLFTCDIPLDLHWSLFSSTAPFFYVTLVPTTKPLLETTPMGQQFEERWTPIEFMPNHPAPPLYIDTQDRDSKYIDSYKYYQQLFPKEVLLNISNPSLPVIEDISPLARPSHRPARTWPPFLREGKAGEGWEEGGTRKMEKKPATGRKKVEKEMVWGGDLEGLMKEKGKWNLQAVSKLHTVRVNYNNAGTMRNLTQKTQLLDVDYSKYWLPTNYAISKEGTTIDSHLNPVLTPHLEHPPSMAICTSPIRAFLGDIEEAMRGWLEYNRMMGIQKVYTYIVKSDVSSSSDIPEILKIYRELGMIDVVQLQDLNIMPPQIIRLTSGWGWWTKLEGVTERRPSVHDGKALLQRVTGRPIDVPLPLQRLSRKLIHSFGEIIAYQDCLYRNAGRHRWLWFYDFDEFIVPYKDAPNFPPSTSSSPFPPIFQPQKFSPFSLLLSDILATNQRKYQEQFKKSGGVWGGGEVVGGDPREGQIDGRGMKKVRVSLFPNMPHGVGFYHQLICPYRGPLDAEVRVPPDCDNPLSAALARTFVNDSKLCDAETYNLQDTSDFQCLFGFSNSSWSPAERYVSVNRMYSPIYEQREYRAYHRSKFSIDPLFVSIMGVHFPFETLVEKMGVDKTSGGRVAKKGGEWGTLTRWEELGGDSTSSLVASLRERRKHREMGKKGEKDKKRFQDWYEDQFPPIKEVTQDPSLPKFSEMLMQGETVVALPNPPLIKWLAETFKGRIDGTGVWDLPNTGSGPSGELSYQQKFILLYRSLNSYYRAINGKIVSDSMMTLMHRHDTYTPREVATLQHRRAYTWVTTVGEAKLGTCYADFSFVNRYGRELLKRMDKICDYEQFFGKKQPEHTVSEKTRSSGRLKSQLQAILTKNKEERKKRGLGR